MIHEPESRRSEEPRRRTGYDGSHRRVRRPPARPAPASTKGNRMRKHLLALILLAASAAPALAQTYAIDRGSIVLDGTVSYTSQGGDLYESADGDRLNTALLNPSVMYFISPGLAIGGDLYVERISVSDASLTTLGIGPAISYYFGEPESTVYPFVSANVVYANLSSDFGDASGFGVAFGGGAAFMLSRAVGLVAEAEYMLESLEIDGVGESTDGNTFRLGLGIAAFLF
jgi:hypothetical protein